jgi:MSHA biogenesis protein MshJ
MLNKLQERFQSLAPREKVIVVAACLVAFWGGWDHFIYQPLALKQNTLKQQLANLKAQINSQQQTAALFENSGGNIDPNVDNQTKLVELKAQYSRLQEQVMLGNKKFVPPSLMAKALSDMLKQNQHLTLIKLDTLPITTLLAAKQQQHPIYKHGLSITFTGNYINTINYLKALEALPWAIVWDSIDYQVKDYPMAEITIHVITLSFEEGWLGV